MNSERTGSKRRSIKQENVTKKAASLNSPNQTPKKKFPSSKQVHDISSEAEHRKKDEAYLKLLMKTLAPGHERLVGSVRKWFQNRLPTAHEIVYEYRDFFVISYSPTAQGYEGVFAIRANTDGVQLYFNNGKELSDPAKLLRGSAKLVRYIAMESASTLRRSEVLQLVDEAILRTPVKFSQDGHGSLIVRPTKAEKNRK